MKRLVTAREPHTPFNGTFYDGCEKPLRESIPYFIKFLVAFFFRLDFPE